MPDRPLYPARRAHLNEMTGPLGIWQHARGTAPNTSFGYCTDDVARALSVDLLQSAALGWPAVAESAARSLGFLHEAFDPAAGTFRNFRSADGVWLDEEASQDSQGRALLSLGVAGREIPDMAMRLTAGSVFRAALPGARRLTELRAMASAILGCDAVLEGGSARQTERTFVELAGRLRHAFAAVELDGDWPWPEPAVTYENALLPHALIVAGRRLSDSVLTAIGIRVFDWLLDAQTASGGWFSPIGNAGWWPRGGTRSRFDQQPIEAATTIRAALAALDLTGDQRYRRVIETAYAWFLGDNDARIVMADTATGGCRDGLSAHEANSNQGAESTLMWLTALETTRLARSRATAAPDVQPRDPVAPFAVVHP